ncbi:MAG: family 1 glycosylhydrolase [Oscillospiraceae bacterium]|nr:family 1 glycosylhydrolase [Oscillospiraceae bacterium]
MFGFKLGKDFLIGTGNSAFQSEGAWDRDGKSENIMEHYAREFAGKYAAGYVPGTVDITRRMKPYSEDLPDRGCFFYDHYEAYIEDMKKTGQNTYRFSLSWCRIIPAGVGEVNPKGIEFYNKVINKCLECNITPFVDLYHWDLPQCLMEKGGFLNPEFPQWFEAYAKVCFEAFGDRVKLWSTFNESDIAVTSGYGTNRFPPFREGNREGQLAGHHVLIAHFRAVRLYKSMNLGGKIGAVNCFTSITPARMCQEDIDAAARQTERRFGWWTEPMLEGRYPQRLIRECAYVRDNMPVNYQEDLDRWFIPMDFLGVNYYICNRTQYDPDRPMLSTYVENFYSSPGQQFAPYPPGLLDVLLYIKDRYHNIPVYITENGCALENINDPEKECDDPERITYLREHLRMCARALRAGCNLKGYYYWNDADSYEELDGYRLRFGLTWVDSSTGERRWKKSRHYFSEICKTKMVD